MVSSSSGVKNGTLKFLGPTTFATGNWAGVELDDPVGKNDGSVAGKRYFECEMKHGLFAPLHKITRLGGPKGGSTTVSTRVVSAYTPENSPLRRRTGSHESLNSSMSSASSLARAGKVRLGVKALTNTQKPTRPAALNTSTNNSALQVALKEKVEHIEQLLKERDLERSEVARAAAQKEEAEQKLSTLQVERQRLSDEKVHVQNALQDRIENLELEKNELSLLLEDEKKKVDDLQFRMEEEEISKSELESQCTENTKKIKDLESAIHKQKLLSSTSESEKMSEADAILTTYKESVEVLSSKVTQLEETVKSLESKEFENNEKVAVLESELMTKEESILQFQSNLEKRKNELSDLQGRLTENETELEKSKERQTKQLGIIDNLNLELNKMESTSSTFNEGVQKFKVENADLKRQLKSSEERFEQLSSQKSKLEEQISHMIQASGDNSEQLTRMNNDLREKETLANDLRSQLSSKSQELEKLKDVLGQVKEQFTVELKKTVEKHSEELLSSSQSLKAKETDIEKLKSQLKSLSDMMSDLESKTNEKGSESVELVKKLNKQEAEVTRLNAKLQETTLQLDVLKQNSTKASGDMEAQVIHLQMEKDILQNEKEEGMKQRLVIEEELKKREEELKKVQHEKRLSDLAVTERDAQTAALKSETDRLRAAFAQHKDELENKLKETELVTKGMQELQTQVGQMSDLEDQLKEVEKENSRLNQELSTIKKAKEEEDSRFLQIQNDLKFEIESKSAETSALEEEISNLKKMLKANEKLVEDIQADLNKQKVLAQQKGSEEKLQYYKNLSQKLEDEKKQLENKVVELQVSVARSQVNANSADPMLEELKSEKESLAGQIEFLNSVIVDMQRKNDELNNKVKSLENGENFDATDLNLNGIKTVVAPRLFCDICDRFDLHDTEDCPTQSSFEEPPHSQHHGQRNADRPYCTTCEVFGHSNDNCDDNEMF